MGHTEFFKISFFPSIFKYSKSNDLIILPLLYCNNLILIYTCIYYYFFNFFIETDHILKFHLLFQLHRRHHQILVTLLHVAVMLFVIEVVVHACLDISVMLILDADMSVQPMANVHLLVPAKEENVLIPVLEPVVLWQYVQ